MFTHRRRWWCFLFHWQEQRLTPQGWICGGCGRPWHTKQPSSSMKTAQQIHDIVTGWACIALAAASIVFAIASITGGL